MNREDKYNKDVDIMCQMCPLKMVKCFLSVMLDFIFLNVGHPFIFGLF